ncbi:uncharacterized protein [Nicotiana sylvestris]|uniref:uncharacterized protein n=1 Tax=Nicotiana sylvestris TaxID=4096 RepID=UPI00388C93C7
MLTTEYELFRMKDDESIQHMHTRFISIITELHSLGETIPRNKLVRKILSIMPSPWESKVNVIIESKDLQELTIEELVGNLKTYEMKRKIESEKREPKKEKNMVLKDDSNDSSEEDSDMAYLTKRFQKMQEFSKNNPEKAAKKNPVPFKDFKRKRSTDNVMKQALAAWEDSSSESEYETDAGDSSIMAVAGKENEYDSTFNLMAQSDDDEDDDNKEDRDSLTLELGEAEQTRDDLVAVVTDHKETIENFKEERNDLLEVIADLREIIERPETNSKPENSGKGKEIASEEHIRLKNELKAVRTRICVETEKNKHLQTHLERVKNDLEKFLKWTWSSEAVTAMYTNNGGNRHGIGFQRKKTPYNPHSKYVIVSDNWLCTHCGNNGHFKENFQARVQSAQKNKVFAEKVTIKEGPGSTHKKCTSPALTKRALIHPLAYYKGPKLSWICDKGNKVEFLSKICTITDLVTGEVVLMAKRYKNTYVADFKTLQNGDLSCLKAVDDDVELWHRRLGHVSFSLLNKLIQKDLVHDETLEVFVAFVKKIQVKMESRVACIRSDHGIEFDNAKFDDFCNENGITHNFSAPKPPQQNGVVERKNRTLEEMARTMLIDSGITMNFWAEAFSTTYYLLNRCMMRSLINKTLYELLNGRKSKLTHLRTFRCKCYVLNKGKDKLGKFDAKSDEGIFLGYSSQRKASRYTISRLNMLRKNAEEDQDGEPLLVPGEVIYMTNRKADMMSQVKELSEDNTVLSSMEPGTSITTTKAEKRVVDAVQANSQCEEFAKLMGSEFEMSMMGELNFFLGLQGTRKQNSVALSTAEAEYVAAASCFAQLLWIKQQLEDFGVLTESVPLLCDNTSALNMAKNPVQQKRTKHIDVRHHFLRDNVEKGLICMKFCSIENQITDIFTKALSREHFERKE